MAADKAFYVFSVIVSMCCLFVALGFYAKASWIMSRFDEKVGRIAAALTRIAANAGETAALRAENETLKADATAVDTGLDALIAQAEAISPAPAPEPEPAPEPGPVVEPPPAP
jgi:hypothetical protein